MEKKPSRDTILTSPVRLVPLDLCSHKKNGCVYAPLLFFPRRISLASAAAFSCCCILLLFLSADHCMCFILAAPLLAAAWAGWAGEACDLLGHRKKVHLKRESQHLVSL